MADTLTNPMHVEVISPDGAIYKDDGVDMVVARAEDGEFAVMKRHLPLAAALTMCVVRVKKGDQEERIAVFGGFLETKNSKVNVIAPKKSMWTVPDWPSCVPLSVSPQQKVSNS